MGNSHIPVFFKLFVVFNAAKKEEGDGSNHSPPPLQPIKRQKTGKHDSELFGDNAEGWLLCGGVAAGALLCGGHEKGVGKEHDGTIFREGAAL